MEISRKLSLLADAAKYDASCSSSGSKTNRDGKGLGSTNGAGICHSYTPDGRCISLLKILMTNHCIFDCKYCINRVSSDVPRARFTVEEVVNLTLDFYRRNYIEGLFLSSGIIRDSDYTMEQIIAIARSLRETHNFKGYIHLKTIPGANDDLIAQAGLYADRLSVNIELPTSADLQKLAPEKKRPQLEENMGEIMVKAAENKEDRKKGFKAAPLFVPAGQSTQMIIGATETPDKDILDTSAHLYKNFKLRRVYYSAFSPIPHADARLPGKSPPLVREHRLYQADWMLRFYKYSMDEIVNDAHPNLDIDIDPKTSWALRNRHYFPVDLNKGTREQLLRVPGIGPNTVEKIIKMRKYAKIRLEDLIKLKVALNRAKPFIVVTNYTPTLFLDSVNLADYFKPQPQQTSFVF